MPALVVERPRRRSTAQVLAALICTVVCPPFHCFTASFLHELFIVELSWKTIQTVDVLCGSENEFESDCFEGFYAHVLLSFALQGQLRSLF